MFRPNFLRHSSGNFPSINMKFDFCLKKEGKFCVKHLTIFQRLELKTVVEAHRFGIVWFRTHTTFAVKSTQFFFFCIYSVMYYFTCL
jgi:hypothetical protein